MEMLTFTTAPPSYDGFGTRIMKEHVGDYLGNVVRLVSTPVEYAKWQRDRYKSGLYLAVTLDQWADLCLAKLSR